MLALFHSLLIFGVFQFTLLSPDLSRLTEWFALTSHLYQMFLLQTNSGIMCRWRRTPFFLGGLSVCDVSCYHVSSSGSSSVFFKHLSRLSITSVFAWWYKLYSPFVMIYLINRAAWSHCVYALRSGVCVNLRRVLVKKVEMKGSVISGTSWSLNFSVFTL